MRFRLVLLLGAPLLMLAGGDLHAQSVEAEFDHAVFFDEVAGPYLELYLAFDALSIPFLPDSNRHRGVVDVEVTLQPRAEDEDPMRNAASLSFVTADPASLRRGQQFLHTLRLPVEPGTYGMEVALSAEGRAANTLQGDLNVPTFDRALRLSDPILASGMQEDSGATAVLSKNGVSILPNPGLLFGSGINALHYYVEAYRLGTVDTSSVLYTRAYVSRTGVTTPVSGFEREQPLQAGGNQALLGSFDISLLSTGSYTWRLELVDGDDAVQAAAEKKFFVYNPDVQRGEAEAAAATGVEASPYAVMGEEELDRLWDQMEIIATRDERRRLRRVKELEERREFASRFWRRRDPNPLTPVNEFREEFDLRVQFARERFEEGKREGWDTVRGRVVLRYGIPDDVEDRFNQNDAVPHSIWTYTNIPGVGRAFFVFADRQEFGSFELIHSDAPGETRSPNWQAEVYRRR